jgi:hypothetical protein
VEEVEIEVENGEEEEEVDAMIEGPLTDTIDELLMDPTVLSVTATTTTTTLTVSVSAAVTMTVEVALPASTSATNTDSDSATASTSTNDIAPAVDYETSTIEEEVTVLHDDGLTEDGADSTAAVTSANEEAEVEVEKVVYKDDDELEVYPQQSESTSAEVPPQTEIIGATSASAVMAPFPTIKSYHQHPEDILSVDEESASVEREIEEDEGVVKMDDDETDSLSLEEEDDDEIVTESKVVEEEEEAADDITGDDGVEEEEEKEHETSRATTSDATNVDTDADIVAVESNLFVSIADDDADASVSVSVALSAALVTAIELDEERGEEEAVGPVAETTTVEVTSSLTIGDLTSSSSPTESESESVALLTSDASPASELLLEYHDEVASLLDAVHSIVQESEGLVKAAEELFTTLLVQEAATVELAAVLSVAGTDATDDDTSSSSVINDDDATPFALAADNITTDLETLDDQYKEFEVAVEAVAQEAQYISRGAHDLFAELLIQEATASASEATCHVTTVAAPESALSADMLVPTTSTTFGGSSGADDEAEEDIDLNFDDDSSYFEYATASIPDYKPSIEAYHHTIEAVGSASDELLQQVGELYTELLVEEAHCATADMTAHPPLDKLTLFTLELLIHAIEAVEYLAPRTVVDLAFALYLVSLAVMAVLFGAAPSLLRAFNSETAVMPLSRNYFSSSTTTHATTDRGEQVGGIVDGDEMLELFEPISVEDGDYVSQSEEQEQQQHMEEQGQEQAFSPIECSGIHGADVAASQEPRSPSPPTPSRPTASSQLFSAVKALLMSPLPEVENEVEKVIENEVEIKAESPVVTATEEEEAHNDSDSEDESDNSSDAVGASVVAPLNAISKGRRVAAAGGRGRRATTSITTSNTTSSAYQNDTGDISAPLGRSLIPVRASVRAHAPTLAAIVAAIASTPAVNAIAESEQEKEQESFSVRRSGRVRRSTALNRD